MGVGLLYGGLHGHFDRANCLNPLALFAMLCTVPRRHLLLFSATTRSLGRNSLSTLLVYRNRYFWVAVPCRYYIYSMAEQRNTGKKRERIDDE